MALSSERLAARRQNLVEAAQALIRERGDAGFSMAMLAKRAGVSPATPYNLLGSKSEILRLVIRDDTARFGRELEGHRGSTPLASLLAAADMLVSHYEGDRQLHIGLFRAAFGTDTPEVHGVMSTESLQWWTQLVEAAIESGEIAGFVRAGQLTEKLLCMMGSVSQTWIAGNWTPERFALEMSVSARLVLASVSEPAQRDQMVSEIADLHARIEELLANSNGTEQPISPTEKRSEQLLIS